MSLGTPVTTVRRELEGRIEALDSEIEYNRKQLALAESTIAGHERQIEMLTELRAGYAALISKSAPVTVSIQDA